MTKHIILFLAANPLGKDRLALDEEARAIQEELERSGHRDKFELVTRWAVRPMDLLRTLRRLKPTIVHFSGHGGRSACGEHHPDAARRRDIASEPGAIDSDHHHGLYFQGPEGRPQLVSTAVLQETFRAAGSSVKLIVLGACYSDAQAEALLVHADCVVGVGGAIRDDVARNFAIGFYGGVGERESVAAAYQQGCAAICLEGLPDSERPKLNVRPGVDVHRLVLAEGRNGTITSSRLPAWAKHDTDPEAAPRLVTSTPMHRDRDEVAASRPDSDLDRAAIFATLPAQWAGQPPPRPVPDTESLRAVAGVDGNGVLGVGDQRASALPPAVAPTSVARIVVARGNDAGRLLEIRPGKTYTIGRGIANDLVLTDITVSRKHFELRYENSAWILVDHGSGNGTIINDRIEDGPYRLPNAAIIEAGTTAFRFDVITAAPSVSGLPGERSSHEASAAHAWVTRIVNDPATLELLRGILQTRRCELCDDDPDRATLDQLIGALEPRRH